LVALCAQTIRIPSPNPPGDTRDIARFVVQHLAASGLDAKIHAPLAEMPNVVATLGVAGAHPHVVLNAHLDQFPATPEGWTYPPYAGVVADGKIWGRSGADMKGGVAAALFIAREMGRTPPRSGRITFSFSSDEESGGKWGTTWLLDNVAEMKGDACIIGDQLGTWAVGVAEKGILWLRLRATGRPGHAAYGSKYSANRTIVRAATVALGLARPVRVDDPQYSSLVEAQRPEMHRWGEQAIELPERVTVNVGKINGGISPNLVAAEASAEIDFRLPWGVTCAGIIDELRAGLDREGLQEVSIERMSGFDPSYTSVSDPLAKAVIANSCDARGSPSLPVVRLGASDARIFRSYGVPTIVYGPEANNMGGIDEHITLDDLVIMTSVHAGAAADLLATR
jgi:succinyl-diaminopimelate desuccinylase